ncbi:MAG: dephospho-CoA kinase [Bacteroidetes bacterium]|jgi:dephospho-CoA kinase|nr:dephospho-CoA kinase [Bacteroidota bacterium]
MITVGITGGIGSGKTTVASVWEDLGARVVYADDLAKKLMRNDPELKKKLTEVFGENTFAPDGNLNKPHLIAEAFQKGRVDELNAIVHPAIGNKARELIETAREEHVTLFAYEAAVLLNYGRPDYLDYILLILSDEQKRVSRVLDRDNVSKQDVTARMEKQPDFNQLKPLADFIIENNGTVEELRQESVRLYRKLIGNH